MQRITLFFAAFLLIIATYAQKPTHWLGPTGNGKYPDTGLLDKWPADGPKMLWHFDDLGTGHSSPAFANGKIYTLGMFEDQGYLLVLSEEGKLIKKVAYGKSWDDSYSGTRSTPTIAGNLIYIYSAHGKLVCIEDESWKIVWSKKVFEDFDGRNIKWGVTETPLIDGKKIFISPGGQKNNIIALDRYTGDLIWSSEVNGEKSSYCSPMLAKLANRKLLVTMMQKHVVGLDAETGKMLWKHKHENRYSIHPNTPQYLDGSVFYMSGYGSGAGRLKLSEDGATVEKLWFTDQFDSKMGSAVIKDGYIYGSGDKNRGWQAVDWKTGEQRFYSKELAKGVVIYADGKLYCYTERGELALVNPTPEKFDIISKTKVKLGSAQHWAYPVIHNKRLYVRHGEALMAYDIAK